MLPLSEISARSAAALGAVAARAKGGAAALGAAALARRRSSLTEDWLGFGEGDDAGGADGFGAGDGEARAAGGAAAQRGEPSLSRPRRALSAGVLSTAPLHSAYRTLRPAPHPVPCATRPTPCATLPTPRSPRHAPHATLPTPRATRPAPRVTPPQVRLVPRSDLRCCARPRASIRPASANARPPRPPHPPPPPLLQPPPPPPPRPRTPRVGPPPLPPPWSFPGSVARRDRGLCPPQPAARRCRPACLLSLTRSRARAPPALINGMLHVLDLHKFHSAIQPTCPIHASCALALHPSSAVWPNQRLRYRGF